MRHSDIKSKCHYSYRSMRVVEADGKAADNAAGTTSSSSIGHTSSITATGGAPRQRQYRVDLQPQEPQQLNHERLQNPSTELGTDAASQHTGEASPLRPSGNQSKRRNSCHSMRIVSSRGKGCKQGK